MNHKVIGISQSFSPAPFVRALKERLQSTFLPDGSRPRIELVDLDWSSPDADAPKLVQEGDVKIRVLEESYQLIEKGAQVIALCNFRNISFLNEVQTEITTPVTDILQAASKSSRRILLRNSVISAVRVQIKPNSLQKPSAAKSLWNGFIRAKLCSKCSTNSKAALAVQ